MTTWINQAPEGPEELAEVLRLAAGLAVSDANYAAILVRKYCRAVMTERAVSYRKLLEMLYQSHLELLTRRADFCQMIVDCPAIVIADTSVFRD